MQRIPALPLDSSDPQVAELFGAIKSKMGMVPNILRTMANSPAAVEAYLAIGGALGNGNFDAADRERIALATAGANRCDYCASAHSALGKMAGLDQDEIDVALKGSGNDARTAALARFSRRIVDTRGFVTNDDLTAFRAAGFSDGDAVEVIANVIANIFTNYFNHIAETEIDFPVVRTAELVAA